MMNEQMQTNKFESGRTAAYEQQQKIRALEQLCTDMWSHLCIAAIDQPYVVLLSDETRNELFERMKEIGLIER